MFDKIFGHKIISLLFSFTGLLLLFTDKPECAPFFIVGGFLSMLVIDILEELKK